MKRLRLFVALMIILQGISYSSEKPDSLMYYINNGPPARKAYYLAEYSLHLKTTDTLKKKQYSEEAILLAKSSSDKENLAIAYFSLGQYFSHLYYYHPGDKASSDSTIYYLDKAYKLINYLKDDKYKSILLSSLGYAYHEPSKMFFFDLSNKYCINNKDYSYLLSNYQRMFYIYLTHNENQKSDSVIRICLNTLKGNISDDSLLIKVVEFAKWSKHFGDHVRAIKLLIDYRYLIDHVKNSNSKWQYYYERSILEWYLAKYASGLKSCDSALNIAEYSNQKHQISITMEMYGIIYSAIKMWDKAISFYEKAITVATKIKNDTTISRIRMNLGVLNMEKDNPQYDYAVKILESNKALFRKSLIDVREDSYFIYLMNICECYFYLNNIVMLDRTLTELKSNYSLINRNETMAMYNLSFGRFYYLTKDYKNAELFLGKALFFVDLTNNYVLKRDILNLYPTVLKNRGRLNDAFLYALEWSAVKDTIDKQVDNRELGIQQAYQEIELERQKQRERETKLEERQKANIIIITILIIAAILLFGFLILIYRERAKSEKLLLNILPKKIARRLKKKEKYIAERFQNTSVMFIDIADFTKMSSGINPEKIVSILNDIFTQFDILSEKHGLEKIKTIGDCYLAVSGIPEPRADHTLATADMAIDIVRTMKDYATSDGLKIKFRIGIDCGPVVAGIIGKNKFIYDIWSDTVNIASRMEDYGVVGEIQVSDRFKNEVESSAKNRKNSYQWIDRGAIEIKGKGRMQTWLLREAE